MHPYPKDCILCTHPGPTAYDYGFGATVGLRLLGGSEPRTRYVGVLLFK